MADKEVIEKFKIMAPGGQATPAPPLGPVLGAKGMNPDQFIQQFFSGLQGIPGHLGFQIKVHPPGCFDDFRVFDVQQSLDALLVFECRLVQVLKHAQAHLIALIDHRLISL